MFREMRRRERELSKEDAEKMLRAAPHGTLALHGDDGYPYSVPVSFAYDDGKIYFHGATAGHKFDAISANDKACISVVAQDDVKPEKFTTHYLSAIAFGRIRILRDREERERAMEAINAKYSPEHLEAGRKYVQAAWDRLGVFEMTVEHLTAKGREGKPSR